jgi:hypothetical protein
MWLARNITTQVTTGVFTGPCELIAIVVNTGAASAVATVYDSISGAGTKIATIDASATNTFFYGSVCRQGLTVVTSGGNADITVIYVEHEWGWDPYADLNG